MMSKQNKQEHIQKENWITIGLKTSAAKWTRMFARSGSTMTSCADGFQIYWFYKRVCVGLNLNAVGFDFTTRQIG